MTDRVLYFDLVGGAAGDMIVASLIDLGASLDRVRQAWEKVGLDRVTAEVKQVDPAGLRALCLDVCIDGVLADSDVPEGTSKAVLDEVEPATHASGHHDHHGGHHHGSGHHDDHEGAHDHQHGSGHHDHGHHHHAGHRPYRAIRKLIDGAGLPPAVVRLAHDAFRRLAEAESLAHGIDVEQVVFHEVGADDAIADVVGAATALHELQIDRVVVSPFPLGSGLTRGGHGPIPLPGPATLHLLEGAPIIGADLVGETVTPTGAAILMAMADAFGPAPAMIVRGTGVGAGHKRWPDRPNVVRAVVGESAASASADGEDLVVEANIDDMRPEDLGPLLEALFAAGAADAWGAPLYMKKGRPGLKVSALARRGLESAVVEAFMIHSPTLGVRVHEVRRFRAERRMDTVDTEFGAVRVKMAARPDGSTLAAPEFEDCASRARETGVSTRRVYEAALRGAWSKA